MNRGFFKRMTSLVKRLCASAVIIFFFFFFVSLSKNILLVVRQGTEKESQVSFSVLNYDFSLLLWEIYIFSLKCVFISSSRENLAHTLASQVIYKIPQGISAKLWISSTGIFLITSHLQLIMSKYVMDTNEEREESTNLTPFKCMTWWSV